MAGLGGRVALVTGGTTGIGAATCEALLAQGATVAATYCGDAGRATTFTARTGIKSYPFSVADSRACQLAMASIAAELGPIDILVNNAGITRDASLVKLATDAWAAVIDTNLTGCFKGPAAEWNGVLT